MKKHLCNRILSLVLAAVMVLGLFPAVSAAPAGLRWEKVDVDVSWDKTDRLAADEIHGQTAHKPTDMVRVSIVLEDAPTLKAGYATESIGTNAAALAYDQDLLKVQQTMARTISVQALDGKALDVVWNLTLASNIISANVPYGKLDAVKAVDGVKDVVLERQYALDDAEKVEPNMYTSAGMIGTPAVWQTGLTGAGTRVAIVDTGTDTDHQSFDNGAYLYALKENADARDMSLKAYMESLDLLDADEISAVLNNLNATERIGAQASEYYLNEKLPFAANYVDYNLTVDHDWDNQGSHGSHVAGIAAANRYIDTGADYADARDTVRMSGVAPDAQIITLKVFGNAAGPYDSDYFAAIEDAIWLGCDSVNLSLGSGSPGTSENPLFTDLLDFMATTDTVVVISAGNSGYWAESSTSPYLYSDGVSFHTSGSPGTYTNSLAVASVDNDGTVGKYIEVGGHMIVYSETTGYTNNPMASLDTSGTGTAYDYIYVDGVGVESDYTGLDLTGKVVFCSRGETSFFEKGNIAASLGAAAVVIYNNQSGVINMDLTDYTYSAPCVSILQTDGAAVKAASDRKTTADGLVYYTGTVTVASEMGVSEYNSEYYTMSSFSSWGVPGSLEMKPEITAPGGMIWSVNGVATSGTEYEMMSGTSMAAPQITGMSALVAEYIKAEGLDAKTGLSVRQLAQSLLMSTAVPMREGASGGEYYSILNQGAGLARVDLATAAESYIEVEGMADGKVKVELGEDADREGVYSFSFTIHNLNGEAMTYALSADLFTQDVFDGGNGTMYLDTWTRTLPAAADFAVNGVSLEDTEGFSCDLNGDGVTNTGDADCLLEYLLGNVDKLKADGDVNGDGSVNSYDAHVLLTRLSGKHSVDVPADGSVTVEVQLELTDEVKAYLDEAYPTGAYVEAYVFAEPVTDSEGVAGVTHSIPVLGYYGSWTEPSMYDLSSYVEYAYGMETRAPYLYNINGIRTNYMTINYGDGDEYVFGGNPFVEEAEYLPERHAFNNELGYVLQNLRFSLIRNASASMILVQDADTGDVYLAQELGEMEGAYYHVNQGSWQNTQYKLAMGLDFAGIPEGTRLNVSLVTAPELYCTYDAEGNVTTDWNALAEGAYLTTSFTIDNTAPELKSVKLNDDNTLSITGKDNEFIAAVALMNASGSSILTAAPANQTERGVELTTELDLSYVFGEKFLVAIFDYAENASVYEITLELDNARPYFTAIDRTNVNDDYSVSYVGMEADGTAVKLAPASGREPARAAEYVEGMVFEISNDNKLYVGSDEDLYSFTYLRDLDPEGEWEIVGFNDLAYNKADGKLYGNFYSEKNGMAVPFLCTIDLYTGEMTVLGQMPIDANSMTIDGEGNFYSTIYGASQLYTYTSDVTKTGKAKLVGTLGSYMTTSITSMAWDHNTDELYWGCTMGESSTSLLKLDPSKGKPELVYTFGFTSVGLYIAYEPDQDLFAPVDTVDSVTMPAESSTLVNNSVQLNAQVWPWNVSDSSVTWTSSDPDVAIVDESGLVYGMSQGTAVITATSKLDPGKSASCTVTVTALDKDLKGLVWDENGQVHWASFNTDTIPAYESLNAITPNLPVNATMIVDGQLYASTLDTSSGLSDLYTVDPETFEMTYAGGSPSIAYLDMTYAPSLGYGLGVYFNYICLIDLESGDYLGAWDWTEGATADLVGITYYGSAFNSNYNAYMDYFLILDADGNVYLDAFINTGSQMGYFQGPQYGYIKTIGDPVDYSYFQGFYFDGAYTYWTRFNEADNVVELIVWDCENTDNVYTMGYFGDGVWPVGGLYCDAELNGTMSLADEKLSAASVKSAELMTAIEPVELENVKLKGSLNAVSVNTTKPVHPMSEGVVREDGTVEVAFTVPDGEATNGIVTVTYDSAAMEFTGAAGTTDAFAWTEENENTIKFAFANREALACEELVATLRFAPLTEGETQVNISFGEWNDGVESYGSVIDVTLPHICPSERFVDVSVDQWFHEAVDYVVSEGYMNGMDTTHFGPGLTMNRAQFVTVLYRMEGEPAVTNTGVFTDVTAGQFYTEAAYWALESGITTGATASTFNPGGQLTRTELVTFMYRYAAYKGYDTTATADLSVYRDADQILSFAVDAWNWSVTHGIVSGMTETTLAPMSLTNRAQAATIFQRFDKTFA